MSESDEDVRAWAKKCADRPEAADRLWNGKAN
jgi:hypothetical protein